MKWAQNLPEGSKISSVHIRWHKTFGDLVIQKFTSVFMCSPAIISILYNIPALKFIRTLVDALVHLFTQYVLTYHGCVSLIMWLTYLLLWDS